MSFEHNGRARWTWLWGLAAASALGICAVYLFRPLLSYRLILMGEAEYVGLAATIYAVIPLFATMWIGRMSDRLQRLRALYFIGGLAGSGGMMLLPLCAEPVGVVLVSAIVGLGHTVTAISAQSIIARLVRRQHADRAFGWFTAALSLGQTFGPLIVGLVLGSSSMLENMMHADQFEGAISRASLIGAAIMLLGLLPVLTVPARISTPLVVSSADAAPVQGKASVITLLRWPGVPSQLLAALALLAVLDILTAFLPLVGEANGIPPSWIGVLLAVRGAASFLSRVSIPWLTRILGREMLLIISLCGSAIFVAITAAAIINPVLSLIVMFCAGFLLGLGQPMTMTILVDIVPTQWRGATLALRLVANRAAQVVFPVTAGFVAGPLGPAGAVWFACLALGVSGAERVVDFSRKNRKQDPEN